MNARIIRYGGLFSVFLLTAALSIMPAGLFAQESGADDTVVLTEYSDYQCPACAHFHPIVEKLKEELGERIEVEYRYFPLNNHQFGALTARAAQAAKNQGKFQEMHNLLFEGQQRWSRSPNPVSILMNYAEELELDLEQFEADINSMDTQRTVMEEKMEGQEKGVNATPTFFINGEKVEQNPPSYEAFRELVESYLEN